MLITRTDAGTILIQSGDDQVELTVGETLDLLGSLVYRVNLTGPELERNDEDEWVCPHCHKVQTELVEVDAGSVRHNDAEIDGDDVYPTENGGERDFHTMSWLCGDCRQPVDVPAEMSVTYN